VCWPVKELLIAVFATLRAGLRSRVALQLEVLALRHQLAVYQRSSARVRTRVADRLLWAWLSRAWAGWRDVLVFVRPSTVIAWQRRRFREHWARLSHCASAQHSALRREAAALVVGEPQRSATQLLAEHAVLFLQVVDHRELAPVDPAGERHQ
jgi:hypothetical protein